MIEQLEALAALSHAGTMTAAADRLRLSQSAISKRLAALEARLGRTLIQRDGRRVALTEAGRRLLRRAEPLVTELRAALAEPVREEVARMRLGASESLLSSWGAEALASAIEAAEGLEVELHAHRSPVVVERVLAGEYALGLCAGVRRPPGGLRAVLLAEEPMVLVPSGLEPIRWPRRGMLEVLTIEAGSATWRSLARQARALRITPTRTLENFVCVAHMARAGLGHGLVPIGVARTLGIPPDRLRPLPGEGLRRPVSLVGRKTTLGDPRVEELVATLRERIEETSANW